MRRRKLEAENAALRNLAEYARHDDGCNGPFGYRCKCGYDRAFAARAVDRCRLCKGTGELDGPESLGHVFRCHRCEGTGHA